LPGGNGCGFDHGLLAGWTAPRPWLLAGGLSVETVAGAIAASGAEAVDVSSGVESARGVKDADLIARFIAAVKLAES
jgi:phosphoribosylanthranilate isomerase